MHVEISSFSVVSRCSAHAVDGSDASGDGDLMVVEVEVIVEVIVDVVLRL